VEEGRMEGRKKVRKMKVVEGRWRKEGGKGGWKKGK
jgi:hypothetical protein